MKVSEYGLSAFRVPDPSVNSNVDARHHRLRLHLRRDLVAIIVDPYLREVDRQKYREQVSRHDGACIERRLHASVSLLAVGICDPVTLLLSREWHQIVDQRRRHPRV